MLHPRVEERPNLGAHAGFLVTAAGLLLMACPSEGPVYRPDPDPGPSEWTVITRMCGNPWHQSRDGYWPPDSNKPDEYNRDPA